MRPSFVVTIFSSLSSLSLHFGCIFGRLFFWLRDDLVSGFTFMFDANLLRNILFGLILYCCLYCICVMRVHAMWVQIVIKVLVVFQPNFHFLTEMACISPPLFLYFTIHAFITALAWLFLQLNFYLFLFSSGNSTFFCPNIAHLWTYLTVTCFVFWRTKCTAVCNVYNFMFSFIF